MITDNRIILNLKDGTPFTSFRFYNEFLPELSQYYRTAANKFEPPELVLDNDLVLDPATLPLLITLGAYLKDFHKKRVTLLFENDLVSNHVIKFLQRSDFLHIVGDNINPNFPLGRRIFQFDERQVGDFRSKQEQRPDHKVRIYSVTDQGIAALTRSDASEEVKRDDLIEHFSFLVNRHFKDLLADSLTGDQTKRDVVRTMAELITNGLFHSESDTYVMMFSNRYKISCSISDDGIGLYPTISKKEPTAYYRPLEVYQELQQKVTLRMSTEVQRCAFTIFETFYFSMLKNRQGLFDLMLNIVLNCKGYFRMHYDSVQIIVSARMLPQLEELQTIRNKIARAHSRQNFGQLGESEFTTEMKVHAAEAKNAILSLALNVFQKYSQDIQYSAIRMFAVKFRGVHIETEIPKTTE